MKKDEEKHLGRSKEHEKRKNSKYLSVDQAYTNDKKSKEEAKE